MVQASIGKKTRPRGVKEEVAARSRARRETQTALVTIQRSQLSGRRNDPAQELHIEMVDIKALQAASRQVRRRDAVQTAKLKASVARFGIVKPILINARNEVIEGHGVLEAAKALGVEKIPAIVIDHLEPAQQRMLRLALNRLGETGAWDFEVLRAEFEELIDLGCEVLDSGFETAEVDALLLEDFGSASEEDEEGATALQ